MSHSSRHTDDGLEFGNELQRLTPSLPYPDQLGNPADQGIHCSHGEFLTVDRSSEPLTTPQVSSASGTL